LKASKSQERCDMLYKMLDQMVVDLSEAVDEIKAAVAEKDALVQTLEDDLVRAQDEIDDLLIRD